MIKGEGILEYSGEGVVVGPLRQVLVVVEVKKVCLLIGVG
jgi:hypothetical protein